MATPASCPCLICNPDPAFPAATTVDAVTRHGWSTLWIAGSLDFAYTVGVYHTFGEPELVMFGLAGADMPLWLNAAVERGRDKGWPLVSTPFDGVMDGFDTQVRDVHPSWYRALFGTALGFYRGVGVPFRQLVWPDRHGHWPWDPDATPSSRHRQAFSWLPVAEHAPGPWQLVGEFGPEFPFPVGPDAWVLTTRGILTGERPVASVAFDQGAYDVLDERGHAADDLCLGFLGDIVHRHPAVRACADLADGQVATATTQQNAAAPQNAATPGGAGPATPRAAGTATPAWERAFVTAADRRTSKRAWTLAEPA